MHLVWTSVLAVWLAGLCASQAAGLAALEGGLRVALHAQVEATKEKVLIDITILYNLLFCYCFQS